MQILGYDIFKRASPSMGLKDPKTGWLSQMLNFRATPVPVTDKSVLGISAYWRCINLITSSIASLPIKLHTQESNSTTVASAAIQALRHPNPNITAFTYNEMLIGSALTYGNGYAYIDRSSRLIELTPIWHEHIEPFMYDGEIFYRLKYDGIDEVISKEDIIHLRGYGQDVLKGISVIESHRVTLGLALASQKENLNFYAKGTKIDGYIKMPGKLDQPGKDSLKLNFSKNYGINGTGQTAVLDNDMEYVRLGMPPADAKFIENSEYTDTQIATIFGVPAHKINQLDRATHSNIESQNIEFVQDCLMPWIRKLEQEYYRKLLTPSEQMAYYFKYNVNALMRGDSKSRAEYYRIMISSMVMTPGEARALEDLDPIEGDDVLYAPLNMIPITSAEEYYKALIESKKNKNKKKQPNEQ